MSTASSVALSVRQCCYREAAPDWYVEPHRHDIHQWYLCLHGLVQVRHGGTLHDLGPERSFLVPPDCDRELVCPGRAPGYLFAIFCAPGLDLTPISGQVLALPGHLRDDLHALVEEVRRPGGDSHALIAALLTRLLIGHKRARSDAGPSVPALNARSHADIIRAADAWMAAHLSQPMRRRELAAALHLSEPHLARIYRAGTGRTIIERLTELRLQAAKSLLLESTLSVTQVAGEVGIISFSHFARVFKQAVGVTPGDYRRSGGNAYQESNQRSVIDTGQ